MNLSRTLPKLSWVLLYLGATGSITEEDLYLYLIAHPRLSIVLENYDYFVKKYRERTVLKYIKDILTRYKREDIFSQLKLLSAIITQVPESKIKLYIPYLAEIISTVERRAIELRVYDHRLERIFEKLYDALYKEKPKINEIVTLLARAITQVEKTETSVRKEIEIVEKKAPIRKKRKFTISEDLLKDFVRMVYEYNKRGKDLLVAEALNEFFSRHSQELSSMTEAYSVYKECLNNKYIEERNKRLYVTNEGKRYIGVS